MESVLKELKQYWGQFVSTDIAKAFQNELENFERWLKDVGVKLLSARAREAAERGNPVAKDYPEQYVKGLVRRGQAKVLVNMFAAYIVHKGLATQYWLIRNKYVAGGESIATWLRLLRKIQ
ncbi:hypothetical protein [Pyrobaculum aerophilum]|uniref:Uncharacterized protein n=1 Tax=Pyrobaculum aerophilum TaxID=13773 RepID=A0A371QVF0_9CREN|nr:hypothetical protein [Pyrobaculum aerophilum]RFA94172.1 hypothetical protein CGL51_11180 [Pyrobaculum aerophilum]RFA99430.1 hypothetical protein CGL52_03465 [Pyrobaculum aerophilum]